jgi:hypothetical protein
MDDPQDNSRPGQSLSLHELRLRLRKVGFEVIPLVSKKPVLDAWQKRPWAARFHPGKLKKNGGRSTPAAGLRLGAFTHRHSPEGTAKGRSP